MGTDIDPALFRETLGHYPTGVAVVTAIAADGTPAGMVVGTFSSVSLYPPLVAFYPTRDSRSFEHLRTAPSFCINVLASDQEPLCRQFATGGAEKYTGVGWRPGPLGSPVLDGAVSWVECTYEEIRDAGDHFIVLGRVRDLAVQRSTLPLLFFQGGYGRFSPGSFIAAPDPELIQAAQLAEALRSPVEQLSAEFGVHCSVLARLRWDVVQVLAVNASTAVDPVPLGHRQPIVPPLGAAFLIDADDDVVDTWLSRAPNVTRSGVQPSRDHHLRTLAKVREGGYSLLVSDAQALAHHRAAISAFEESDRLPRHEQAVRDATTALVDLYCPDLVPGQRYDVESIVVPLTTPPSAPSMGVRMTHVPGGATAEQIMTWIAGLRRVAATSVPSHD